MSSGSTRDSGLHEQTDFSWCRETHSQLFIQITVSPSHSKTVYILSSPTPLGAFLAKDMPVHVSCTESFKDDSSDLQT